MLLGACVGGRDAGDRFAAKVRDRPTLLGRIQATKFRIQAARVVTWRGDERCLPPPEQPRLREPE